MAAESVGAWATAVYFVARASHVASACWAWVFAVLTVCSIITELRQRKKSELTGKVSLTMDSLRIFIIHG